MLFYSCANVCVQWKGNAQIIFFLFSVVFFKFSRVYVATLANKTTTRSIKINQNYTTETDYSKLITIIYNSLKPHAFNLFWSMFLFCFSYIFLLSDPHSTYYICLMFSLCTISFNKCIKCIYLSVLSIFHYLPNTDRLCNLLNLCRNQKSSLLRYHLMVFIRKMHRIE